MSPPPDDGAIKNATCRQFGTEFTSLLQRMAVPEFDRGTWSTFVQVRGLADLMAKPGLTLHGRRCIDFGCGGLKRFSVSTLLCLLGAREAMGVDLYQDPDPGAVAWAIWALILTAISGEGGIDPAAIGTSAKQVRERATAYDLPRLLQGDLGGLPEEVSFRLSDYRALPEAERRFDALVSFSVFEHVHDLADCLAAFRRAINPDGFVYAAIDYRDHRSYVGPESWWRFMVDEGDLLPNYITKQRHSAVVAMIERAGFRIAESLIARADPAPEERAQFLPHYAALSDSDIRIVEARVLLRPV
ncbi:MAG TPA: methyltransferase domain-containing protein [Acetobacteraceae bacterium]|nr:methyltransferase domain-containing protein [Acetobacteraceae bacterium]